MTTEFKKEQRDLEIEKLIDPEITKHFDDETEKIGKKKLLE
jgi:hypothetical protein